jgi:hypothetical protein
LVVDEKADAEDAGPGAAMKGAPTADRLLVLGGSPQLDLEDVGVAAPAPQLDARVWIASASVKMSSGGLRPVRQPPRPRHQTRRPASIPSRLASRAQPASHLTAVRPSLMSWTLHEAAASSCAG